MDAYVCGINTMSERSLVLSYLLFELLRKEFFEDKKYHYLMTRLKGQTDLYDLLARSD